MATYLKDAMAIMQLCETPLSREFFSEKNLDYLQLRLQQAVKKKTGHVIDRQSDMELVGIMRGVFEGFSNNYGGKNEIQRLNNIVLDIVVEQCVSGIKGYLGYLKDASTMPTPLSRGTFASIKGERTLEYKIGFGK